MKAGCKLCAHGQQNSKPFQWQRVYFFFCLLQLLAALKSLKTVGVIHTNIKPHNIMVVNQKHKPFRVKLTDFGSAIKAAEVKRGVIMQPIGYRWISFSSRVSYLLFLGLLWLSDLMLPKIINMHNCSESHSNKLTLVFHPSGLLMLLWAFPSQKQ